MKPRFRHGLVVGKFAPLHRGHQLVIQAAEEQCEEVAIISYSHPEFPGCEPARRVAWLAELYPKARRLVVTNELLAGLPASWPGPRTLLPNDGDESAHRRFVGQLCQHVLGIVPEAVFTSEDYGDGFAAELTALFRQSNPSLLSVQHVQVDRARLVIPTSGTAVRRDVHALSGWLPPVVYASFVQRVALLGGESSGKSTLAVPLAEALGTVSVAEYGRELWETQGGELHEPDLLHIAETQVAREDAVARSARRWLICDTTPLTTLFYSHDYFQRAPEALRKLAERPYDVTVLCAPDFPFVQDGTRRDAAFRQAQHEWYLNELQRRGIPFVIASGSPDERVAWLADYLKRQ